MTPVRRSPSRAQSMPMPCRSSSWREQARDAGRRLGRLQRQDPPAVVIEREGRRRCAPSPAASRRRGTRHIRTRGERRNLRRAGTLSNRPSTRMRVPGGKRRRPLARRLAVVDLDSPAVGAPRTRLSSVSRETLAIDGSASPRKPKLVTWSIASSGSFEVACRSSASRISSGAHAAAVVGNLDQLEPARGEPHRDWFAPASSAFSISSLSALAGRSTTSPAAMRLMSSGGSLLIDMLTIPSPFGGAGEALIFRGNSGRIQWEEFNRKLSCGPLFRGLPGIRRERGF